MTTPDASPADSTPDPRHDPASLQRYWRRNVSSIVALMAIGALVTFGVSYAARSLQFTFFGWPFSFWVAAQGAMFVYLGIVWWYARRMSRLDAAHGLQDEDAP